MKVQRLHQAQLSSPRPPRLCGSILLIFLGLTASLTGCASLGLTPPSALTIRGQADPQGPPLALTGDFTTAYYRYTDANAATFVLLEGPEDRPTQAAVVRLFWRPRAGLTPIDATATNCSVQYLVFAHEKDADRGQVGVYAGAGFLYLSDTPGGSTVSAALWDANVRLDAGSDAFRDLLGQAQLEGSFTAKRDDAKVQQLITQLNRLTTERLGYPRLVQHNARLVQR